MDGWVCASMSQAADEWMDGCARRCHKLPMNEWMDGCARRCHKLPMNEWMDGCARRCHSECRIKARLSLRMQDSCEDVTMWTSRCHIHLGPYRLPMRRKNMHTPQRCHTWPYTAVHGSCIATDTITICYARCHTLPKTGAVQTTIASVCNHVWQRS